MHEQNGGTFWESLWPCLSAFDVIRVRATAKDLNDAKKHGPRATLYFFLLRDMRRPDRTRTREHKQLEFYFCVPLRPAGRLESSRKQ